MIGKTISHYTIMEKLGAGGMGVVYKAHDNKLERFVALKFLPSHLTTSEDEKHRFIHEAKAASGLDHPNICTIYEIDETEDGQMFIALACYGGESLKDKIERGPLPIDEALDIAVQIARGLEKAHTKGIIHRDIKPANIMITQDGVVKIVDFGLAKLAGRTLLTKEGSTLGTIAYMSPEQAQGTEVDGRSDIWSMGVVLYEMITGQRAFRGEFDQAVVYSILNENPPSVAGVRDGVSTELEKIIGKCLEKNPSDRFQSAKALLLDLCPLADYAEKRVYFGILRSIPEKSREKLITYARPVLIFIVFLSAFIWFIFLHNGKSVSDSDLKMLVVLPFTNTGPVEDTYFTIGITDEITSRLSTVPKIGVISRNSASHYAEKDWDTRQIEKELHVDYIVAGTVRWARSDKEGDRVRITPRLIRVKDDIEIWSESFDRIIHDIFDIQSEIAIQVVGQLGITLGESEQNTVTNDATNNLEAYQAFLQGRHLSRSPHFTVDNWMRVIESYQRAVDLDPTYALAYAKLAGAHARLYFLRHDLSEERLILSRQAAEKANELGEDSPEVLLALGYYYLWAYRDREQALEKWDLAAEGLKNDPRILEAKASLCANLGRWDDGMEALEKAIRYNPRDVSLITDLALFVWLKRSFTQAITLCNQAIALAPDENWPYIYKTIITWNMKGANQETRHAIESINQEYHWVPWLWFWQECGEKKFSQALRRLETNPNEWISQKLWARPKSMFKAFIYDFTGETDLAYENYKASVVPLETMTRKWPGDPRYHSSLGMAYAALGRKTEAIEEGKKAMAALPLSKDAEYGQAYEMDMIIIYIMAGEYDAALEKIEFLLSMPSWLSVGWMKFDMRYKPLVGHPGFEELVQKYTGSMK